MQKQIKKIWDKGYSSKFIFLSKDHWSYQLDEFIKTVINFKGDPLVEGKNALCMISLNRIRFLGQRNPKAVDSLFLLLPSIYLSPHKLI